MNVRDLIAFLMVCNPEYAIRIDDRYGSKNGIREVKIDHQEKEVVIIK